MANKRRGYVDVKLDKPRRLKYDLNAVCDIEDRFDAPFQEVLTNREMDFRAVRTLLWAGLTHEDPDLTEREVGAMITISDLVDIRDKIAEAAMLAMNGAPEPSPAQNGAKKKTKPKAKAGSRSA